MLVLYPSVNDAKILSDGFEFGFRINYDGPRLAADCNNLKSVNEFETETEEKIMKEVALGRIAGPFSTRPMPNLRLSPIGLVKKKPPSSGFRLIHHLSYPLGKSVNSAIDPQFSTVQYTSFDKVLDTVASLGKNALLAKMDVKAAFRLLILHPDDFELFGFKFKNNFFFDKCLPMGCSAACALFEKFATFIEWGVRKRSEKGEIEHYLDDFLLAGKSGTNDCKFLMTVFRQVCSELGVPLSEEKTVGPAHILVFLGLEIDTIQMVLRIPQDKLDKAKDELLNLKGKPKVTLKNLQQLLGLLNFCAKAIPSVRAFNRRFCDAMCGVEKQNHHIRVSSEMKEDINMWLYFLDNFNGTCRFDRKVWLTNEQLDLFTDSAGKPDCGAAVFYAGHWAFFPWPESWRSDDLMRDITFLELVPIVLALHLFEHELCLKMIMFHTDNKALVTIINKKSSKSKRVMQLIRPLVLHTMLWDMQVKACHISGRNNCIADAISRKQWERMRKEAPTADMEPLEIPQSFNRLILGMKLTDL